MKKLFLLSLLVSSVAGAVPPATTGNFTVYVDPAGNDVNSCFSSAHACKTPQAASVRVPKYIGHQVTVSLAAGTYYVPASGLPSTAAALNLSGFHLGAGGNLTFTGPALTQVVAPLVASAVSSAGAANTTITLAMPGPPASNAYQGMFAVITAGTGAGANAYPIVSNDGTHIVIVNSSFQTLDTTTTVQIVKSAAVMLPSASGAPTATAVRSTVQVSDISPAGTLTGVPLVFSRIIFKNIEFDDVASDPAFFTGLVGVHGAIVEFINCTFRIPTLSGNSGIGADGNSQVVLTRSAIVATSGSSFGIRAYRSQILPSSSMILAASVALSCSQGSYCSSSTNNLQTTGTGPAVSTMDPFSINGSSTLFSGSDYISGSTLSLTTGDASRVTLSGDTVASGNIWVYDGSILDFDAASTITPSFSLDKGVTTKTKGNVEAGTNKRLTDANYHSIVYED